MQEKIVSIMLKIIGIVYFAVMCGILLSIIMSDIIAYYTKPTLGMSNVAYLVTAVISIVCVALLATSVKRIRIKADIRIIIVVSIFLGIIQLVLNYMRYFYTGWDAAVIADTVSYELTGAVENINSVYFSVYSNNLLIVFIYKCIGKVALLFGIRCEIALLLFNQVINTASAVVVFLLTDKIYEKKTVATLAYGIYQIFIGFSPWFIISYSDTFAIMFPLLIALISINMFNVKRWGSVLGYGIAIAVLTVVGAFIKPQILIVSIAIVIYALLSCLKKSVGCDKKKVLKKVIEFSLCIIMGIMVTSFVCVYLFIYSLDIPIEKEYSFGPLHYVMMGLNDETDGVFSDSDVDISISTLVKSERTEIQKSEIARRITTAGPAGLAKHLLKKNMVNFCDGTFGWFVEGDFFLGIPQENVGDVNMFLYDFIIPGEIFYGAFSSLNQITWFIILVLSCASAVGNIRECEHRIDVVLILSIIGITLFELIFEARARYLFCYIPFFVIIATKALYSICKMANSELKHKT